MGAEIFCCLWKQILVYMLPLFASDLLMVSGCYKYSLLCQCDQTTQNNVLYTSQDNLQGLRITVRHTFCLSKLSLLEIQFP